MDSIRALGRVDEHRTLFMDALYTYNAVMKANMRWLTESLEIISDVLGLTVTFGASMFAINKKHAGSSRINIVGSSIALSNKLSLMCSSIAKDASSLESQIRSSYVSILRYAEITHELRSYLLTELQ